MEKVLLLGGSYTLLPIIKRAHQYGWYVITMDYFPDNLAHKYSDEFANISVIDKEAVLAFAEKTKIKAISSFGCDAGAVSAAYVAEKMGLPYVCSYEAACILQDKALFRSFLRDHNFNVPYAKGFSSKDEALHNITELKCPVIVKPVDSAGSKGVSRCDSKDELEAAIDSALANTHSNAFIIEEFLEKEGPSSGSETFFQDGIACFNGVYDQFFDSTAPNPFVPAAECWPSTHNKSTQDIVYAELNRLASLLHIRTGLMNVEWRVSNGKPYLMEVTPRAGGNRLAEMLSIATDVDIVDAEVRQILGMTLPKVHEPIYKGYFANLVIHSHITGILSHVEIDADFRKKHLIEEDLWVKKGEHIDAWTGGNHSIGILFLRFVSCAEMMRCLEHANSLYMVKVVEN